MCDESRNQGNRNRRHRSTCDRIGESGRGIQAELELIAIEERGARDALAQAFEEQKKYEQVAESARLAEVKEVTRRENAELDEVGMRAARRAG